MIKTAILLGATGLVGGHLLELLLEDGDFDRVIIFGRSSAGVNHPKIEEHLIDLFQLGNYERQFQGDALFCCIGTTKAKTPKKEQYKRIDHGIPVAAAQLAKTKDVPTIAIVSSMGADPDSRIFYNKVKGQMERDVLALQIPHTYLLQPSLIGGDRKEKRTGERLAKKLVGFFGFLLPERYKMIHPQAIAKAMLVLSKTKPPSGRVPSAHIKELASRYQLSN